MTDLQVAALASGKLAIVYRYAGSDGYAICLLQPTRATLKAVSIPAGGATLPVPSSMQGGIPRLELQTNTLAACEYINALNLDRQDRNDHDQITPVDFK
jgi:hypothetical protein